MGARQRLNGIYILGSVIIAGVIGGVAESWTVFIVAACLLIAVMISGGDIRPTGRHR